MRHRVDRRKLNRNTAHRQALMSNLARAFLLEFDQKGHIVTTRTKAKYCQPKVEKLITLARNKTVHNIRQAMAMLRDREVVAKLFDQIGPYYAQRPGGYTRILRLAKNRLGDNAPRR